MSPTLKTLAIRPLDVGLVPLGATSGVADVEVTVTADRDVALSDGTFIAGGVPIVATSMPTTGLSVPILANDDPNITTGAGFSLVVTARYSPRRGMHGRPQETMRRIVITSADPANINFADAKPVRQVPFYMRPSEYVTYLENTLSRPLEEPPVWATQHSDSEVAIGGNGVVAIEEGVFAVTGPGVTESSDGIVTISL